MILRCDTLRGSRRIRRCQSGGRLLSLPLESNAMFEVTVARPSCPRAAGQGSSSWRSRDYGARSGRAREPYTLTAVKPRERELDARPVAA